MYPWLQKGACYSKAGFKKLSQTKVSDIKRILVIRHAALGDMIQTRPFLYELRRLFPHSEIVLSVASHYQYAAPVDLVDSVHVMYGQDLRNKSVIEKYKNIKEVGSFDLLIDLASTARSELLTFFTKAKLKLGFPYKQKKWLYDLNLFRSDLHHEAELLLEFLYLFGHVPEYPLNFRLPTNDISKAEKRFIYFMGSSQPEKNYPVVEFLKVIEKLSIEFPNHEHLIVQGIKADEKYESEYKSVSHLNNIKLQKNMSLEDLINFVAKTQILISNDTGVRHIGIGTHTPTVGLFSISVPYRYWPRYENIHDCVFSNVSLHPSVDQVVDAVKKMHRRLI